VAGSVLPVFPLAFHFFAGSLQSLRVANAIAGAAIIPITIWLLRDVGVSRLLRYAAAALLVISATLILFSWKAFLDTFGALLALVAFWLYVRRSYRSAAIVTTLATLEKEYLALVGV